MSGYTRHIERWDDLPGAISQLQVAGQHHRAVLLQALYRGLIAHVEVRRDTSATLVKRFIASTCRPALVLFGDDDDAPTGPAGWRQAARLLKWADLVVIHAAAGHAAEYVAIVSATLRRRRVLLVETDSAHAHDWHAAALAAPGRPATHLIVPAGGMHPVPVQRERMQ